MSVSSCCIVLCSCPDNEVATTLAKQIVESKLAACVNVLPGMTSIYTWEDKLETATEVLLIIKTTVLAYSALELYLKKAHPYECPEIIALPIEQGFKGYLQWINNSVEKQ